MDAAIQERTSRQDHRLREELQSDLGDDAGDPVALEQQIVHRLLEEPEVWLVLEAPSNRSAVQHAVSLCACSAQPPDPCCH
jgi:hypothetical protein